MRNITDLFGPSPFTAIQELMAKVAECMNTTHAMILAWAEGDLAKTELLAKQVRDLETESDKIRSGIQKALNKSFLSVNRTRLHEVVDSLGKIADTAENLSRVASLRALQRKPEYFDQFIAFVELNWDIFNHTREIILEFDELQESTFAGKEADLVNKMARAVSAQENEADDKQHALLKAIVNDNQITEQGEFFVWTLVMKQLSQIGNRSHRLSRRVRGLLDLG